MWWNINLQPDNKISKSSIFAFMNIQHQSEIKSFYKSISLSYIFFLFFMKQNVYFFTLMHYKIKLLKFKKKILMALNHRYPTHLYNKLFHILTPTPTRIKSLYCISRGSQQLSSKHFSYSPLVTKYPRPELAYASAANTQVIFFHWETQYILLKERETHSLQCSPFSNLVSITRWLLLKKHVSLHSLLENSE